MWGGVNLLPEALKQTFMKTIKVLHLIDSLRLGGKERQLVELLKGLSKHHDVISELGIMSRDIHYPDVYGLNIDIKFLIRKSRKDPRILAKLYKLCKESRPDIIHSWSLMTSVYAVPVTKSLGVKLINGMVRNAPSLKFFDKAYIGLKLTCLLSDAVVANSDAGLKAYKVGASKGMCIHNGFDFERIKNLQVEEAIRKKFHIYGEKVVGMVGSFSHFKDYETFILSAQQILNKRKDVVFLAIGGENQGDLEKYKRFVKGGYENKIIFIKKQRAVESIINLFDIGILSTHTEGISNSIMEYMSLSKPVVATDCGGTKELVLDGKTGFLVPPSDSKSLSHRIVQLLDDVELAAKMGEESRRRIEEEFNLEKMTDTYVALYQRLMQRRNHDR